MNPARTMTETPYRGTVLVIEEKEYSTSRKISEVILLVILWFNMFLVGMFLGAA